MKFILSAFFISIVLLTVERHSEVLFLTKPRELNCHSTSSDHRHFVLHKDYNMLSSLDREKNEAEEISIAYIYLQLKDENHFIFIIESVV